MLCLAELLKFLSSQSILTAQGECADGQPPPGPVPCRHSSEGTAV